MIGSISKSSGRRLDPLHDRDVRGLLAQIAEIDRERRLRRARDPDEDDVRLAQAAAHAVVELDRELDRLHPLEVGGVERRPGAGRHLGGHSGDLRDRLDRMAEQVGVVKAGAAAEGAHRLAQLAVDERVDHHRRASLRPRDGELEVVDRLDLGVANLLERLLRELRLECRDETRGGLPGRVREDVELDDLARWVHAPEATAATRAPVSRTRSSGASSISRPRRPALTKIVSCRSADTSRSVGSRFRCPSGLIPPST